MNVDELSGDDLNREVAKCYGMHVSTARGGWLVFDSDAYSEFRNEYNDDKLQSFRPSTNWAQGGAIIQRECIELQHWGAHSVPWSAWIDEEHHHYGTTPLIAAMRCYVASKQGE